MNEDLKFLKGLDKKLHKIEAVYGTGLWAHKPRYIDSYTDKKMNKEETEKLISIVKKKVYDLSN